MENSIKETWKPIESQKPIKETWKPIESPKPIKETWKPIESPVPIKETWKPIQESPEPSKKPIAWKNPKTLPYQPDVSTPVTESYTNAYTIALEDEQGVYELMTS